MLFKYLFIVLVLLFLPSCSPRIDPYHVLLRSDVIRSIDDEQQILAKARLGYTQDEKIRVLYTQGTPYERGYQQGALLREEVRDNLIYLHKQAIKKFHFEEFFDEAFERERPFIPQEYIDEMHGLAHGSKLPIKVVHHIHVLPSITEWGGKKRLKELIKSGILGTSCSNVSAFKSATFDGRMYSFRILDWGLHRISKLHEHPLLTINIPEHGYASVNIGWAGFLGAVSGMNEGGITLGEMGYGDPPNESLRGMPMPFLLRNVLSYTKALSEVRKHISEAPISSSFVFLISDGKSKDAELYIKDSERFLSFRAGDDVHDGNEHLPPIKDVVYGGHYEEKMASLLRSYQGALSPSLFMENIIPQVAMPSNFQNVIYDPESISFWVSNASNADSRAAEATYTFFDFGKALREFRAYSATSGQRHTTWELGRR